MEDFFEDKIKDAQEKFCNKCGKCAHGLPTSYWEKMPEGCGYEGWLFQRREAIKQRIRKEKEALLSLGVLLKTATPEQIKEINKQIERINKNIEIYAQYGSADW